MIKNVSVDTWSVSGYSSLQSQTLLLNRRDSIHTWEGDLNWDNMADRASPLNGGKHTRDDAAAVRRSRRDTHPLRFLFESLMPLLKRRSFYLFLIQCGSSGAGTVEGRIRRQCHAEF